jgi:hypothetical protein
MDLTGERYGRLVVMRSDGVHRYPSGQTARWWMCQCDCGNLARVRDRTLRSGLTRSCGCLRSELARERAAKRNRETRPARTHGHGSELLGRSPTNLSWKSMIQRCTNPKNPSYPDWGGRGITICERWRKFENFLADMGERPEGTTLDRIDNDGNYEPGNCRWADKWTQARNRRAAKARKATPAG